MDKMVKVPVRFKDHLNLSNEIKYFIKKCLEVDEAKRMSLSDLKEWLDDPQARLSLGADNKERVTLPPKL